MCDLFVNGLPSFFPLSTRIPARSVLQTAMPCHAMQKTLDVRHEHASLLVTSCFAMPLPCLSCAAETQRNTKQHIARVSVRVSLTPAASLIASYYYPTEGHLRSLFPQLFHSTPLRKFVPDLPCFLTMGFAICSLLSGPECIMLLFLLATVT